eukprot:MONOS_14410.1-p1 / transcript=MONOS_14410.1 / gene=MONOS_14410 / organism=Monocercomonoides_exilis_PA203 / gene_product=unspecified product / transcript_product=unspecified product / location=Mono_scaffold00997:448-2468(-) / protein_length=461 / sequence_SO=supercontig / SO=protein_coding / is_pseudo=false
MGPQPSKKETQVRVSNFFPFTHAQFIKEHTNIIRCLEFIDGDRFASAGDDNRIMIHSFEAAQTLYILEGHTAPITCLFLMDDDYFASGSIDKTVKIWRTVDGQYVNTISEHDGPVKAICALYNNPDLYVSVSQGRYINLWNKEGTVLKKVDRESKDNIFTLLPITRDRIVVTVSESTDLFIYDMSLSESRGNAQKDSIQTTNTEHPSSDAKTKDQSESNVPVSAASLQRIPTTHRSWIISLCMVSPTQFASGSLDGIVCVWSNDTLQPLFQVAPPPSIYSPSLYPSSSTSQTAGSAHQGAGQASSLSYSSTSSLPAYAAQQQSPSHPSSIASSPSSSYYSASGAEASSKDKEKLRMAQRRPSEEWAIRCIHPIDKDRFITSMGSGFQVINSHTGKASVMLMDYPGSTGASAREAERAKDVSKKDSQKRGDERAEREQSRQMNEERDRLMMEHITAMTVLCN